MGGNIFKDARRYDLAEYQQLEREVLEILGMNIMVREVEYYDPARMHMLQALKYYRNKETFGDMDILLNKKFLSEDFIEKIVRVFKLGHGEWYYEKLSELVSFKYKNFQIDLILTEDEDMWSSAAYKAWNDLGNLIGRVSHKHGLRFGHAGTHIVVKEGSNQLGTILVTKDERELFDYLDLNWLEWSLGFDELEDMFKWLVKSKYFNKELYSYENRNHAARTRDSKRKNYNAFLLWLEEQENLPEYPYTEMTSRNGYDIREPYFTEICKKWPHVRVEYERILNEYRIGVMFKANFNGDIIHKITGLENQKLGEFMTWAKHMVVTNNLYTKIAMYSPETCENIIRDIWKSYQNNKPWPGVSTSLALIISKREGLVK